MSDVTSELVEVTPQLAEEMLGKNTHNRNVRLRNVAAIARDIEKDSWQLNGDALKFDVNGRLLDGQHRLLAIVQANKAVPCFIVRGLQPAAQATYDVGARRRFADALHLAGEKSAHQLASLVRTHLAYTHGRLAAGSNTATIAELQAHLDAHPGLRDALHSSDRIRRTFSGAAAAYGVFCYEAGQLDVDDADAFIDRLVTGVNLDADSPILHLRRFLSRYNESRDKPRSHIVLALFIKAWNAYRDGASVQVLIYRSGGASPEPYPVPR